MCDYSLMSFPNRLARQGEELLTYRFPRGTMGLASPADLRIQGRVAPSSGIEKIWLRLWDVFDDPSTHPVPAVCIPPGARLLVRDISEQLQREMKIWRTEEAIFTQLTAASRRHRDALRFRNGRYVLLQLLREGQRVRILDLSVAEFSEPRAEALLHLDGDLTAAYEPGLAAA
jgi:hypothetical protein